MDRGIARHQERTVEYLREENRILRAHLGGRLRLTDPERRRLARLAKEVGRRGLTAVATIATPDTILRWYRELVAKKYDGSGKRGPGRPRTDGEVAKLVVQMASENPTWGYTRSRGALANLGHEVGRNTIRRLLAEQGIEPSLLKGAGVKVVKLPPRSPDLNAFAERFVQSIRSECLDRIVPLGERHLRRVIREYVEHYHRERNHQGLENRLIQPSAGPANNNSRVRRHQRLGGLLNFYARQAA